MPSLFASYLRVYEPLTAFDRDARSSGAGTSRRAGRSRRSKARAGSARRCIEALGAGWTRLPDLPDEAYVLEADDTLLVCPWNLRRAGRRGGAERPRRRAAGARRRVRAAGAGRPGPGGGRGLAQRRPGAGARACRGCTSRSPPGACRCAGSSSSTWRSGSCARAGPAGAALPHRDLQGPAAGPPGAVGAAQVARRRADHRGGRGERRGGWRSSTRGRWWSSTTAAWSTCCRTTTLDEDDSPGLVAAGLAALSRGDADAATEAYEKLVARWRAIQLLERCN